MRTFAVIIKHVLSLAVLFGLGLSVLGQQQTGSLRGQIADEFGGVIIGATVTLTDASGAQKTTQTNNEGVYTFNALAPGKYALSANATGFAVFENPDVEIAAGKRQTLDFKLSVTLEKQEVTVSAETPVSTEAENNASSLVIKGTDLDALPDDPDDLEAALQALAGPSAGPNGGQIYIDGFTGGRIPPKESIREIRINQNPFSAEYDRLGFGRIEILTKPGTDVLRGQGFFTFNDESLNARNPFAPTRAAYQLRNFGGNLSGPIEKKKASFFFDFEKRDSDDNSIINAIALDPTTLAETSINHTILVPRRSLTFSPRVDYQLNAKNTVVARYTFSRNRQSDLGAGEFALDVDPFFGINRTFNSLGTNQTFQLTDTMIVSPTIINETRFQFQHDHAQSGGDISVPVVNVSGSFIGGGANAAPARNTTNRFELQNYTTYTHKQHSIKAGIRIRGVNISDFTQSNFNGTFVFAGLPTVLDANGNVLRPRITSLEQYQQFIQDVPGSLPSQLIIAGGNPLASVSQTDFGLYAQDDWRMRPNFTLSMGLRYENQTNIHSNLNFAPRLSFAWSPGAAGRQPKTVLRGGFGVFYDRFSENLTLNATRFNGTNQQQFIINAPAPDDTSTLAQQQRAILAQFPAVPALSTLSAFALPQITRRVDPNLQSPYTLQSVFSLERQLPKKITGTVTYINTRTLHLLRSRNINAPLNGVRPLGNAPGDIYEYESNGVFNQNQLIFMVNTRFSTKYTIFANYSLGRAHSNTDGAGTFPANQYDLSDEYGRASIDVRQRFFFGGTVALPWWGLRVNPLVIASSGRPFNITTGFDNNGDGLFTDRPAFAGATTDPHFLKVTRFGNFDLNPAPGTLLIPRNFGETPATVAFNLRVSKVFSFGPSRNARAVASGTPGGDNTASNGGRRGGSGSGGRGAGGGGRAGGPFGAGGIFGGGGGGGPRGGGGGFGGGAANNDKRYSMTLSLNFNNILNRVNPGTIVGNLSSPRFGEVISSGGSFGQLGRCPDNRCVEAQIRFSF
jgi:hypothetical protein